MKFRFNKRKIIPFLLITVSVNYLWILGWELLLFINRYGYYPSIAWCYQVWHLAIFIILMIILFKTIEKLKRISDNETKEYTSIVLYVIILSSFINLGEEYIGLPSNIIIKPNYVLQRYDRTYDGEPEPIISSFKVYHEVGINRKILLKFRLYKVESKFTEEDFSFIYDIDEARLFKRSLFQSKKSEGFKEGYRLYTSREDVTTSNELRTDYILFKPTAIIQGYRHISEEEYNPPSIFKGLFVYSFIYIFEKIIDTSLSTALIIAIMFVVVGLFPSILPINKVEYFSLFGRTIYNE